jgi:hypothetical protein
VRPAALTLASDPCAIPSQAADILRGHQPDAPASGPAGRSRHRPRCPLCLRSPPGAAGEIFLLTRSNRRGRASSSSRLRHGLSPVVRIRSFLRRGTRADAPLRTRCTPPRGGRRRSGSSPASSSGPADLHETNIDEQCDLGRCTQSGTAAVMCALNITALARMMVLPACTAPGPR